MTASVVAAVAALTVLTLLPGPDLAVVTRLALSSGRGQALRGALGIVTGLLVWGLLTVAGLAALLAASAVAYAVVTWAGAGYLVLLGLGALWQSRSAPAAARHVPAVTGGSGFRTGLVTNLLNPKIAVFYTGLLPGLVPDGLPQTPSLVGLVLVHCLLTVSWLAGYVTVVVRASGVLQRPRVRRALDRLTGVVLIALGLRVAATARP